MNMKIVDGKGCFSSKHNIDTTSNCSGFCTYCYGNYINRKGRVIVKTCNTKVLDRQWAKLNSKHNIIRIGKYTDPGFETEEAGKLLDWMDSNKIRPVFVTKMPHKGKHAQKISKLGGVYQITIGYDCLEPGCTRNVDRVIIGNSFINRGYRIVYRLLRECTGPADDWTKNFIDIHKDRILVTPLRLKNKNTILQLGGDLSGYDFHRGFYRPWKIHSDYVGLKACLDNLKGKYCGKCLLE